MLHPDNKLPSQFVDPRIADPSFASLSALARVKLLIAFERQVCTQLRLACTDPIPAAIQACFGAHLPGIRRNVEAELLSLSDEELQLSDEELQRALEKCTVAVMAEAAVQGFAIHDFYAYGLHLQDHNDNYARDVVVKGWAAWEPYESEHDYRAYILSVAEKCMSLSGLEL